MKQKIVCFLKATVFKMLYILIGTLLGAIILYIHLMNNRTDLSLWHTSHLDEEYTVEKQADITSFNTYLELENRLFNQLQTEVYNKASTQKINQLNRFESGSLSDPSHYPKNWNRSFTLKPKKPRGAVLLLHGLSDSPYSMRALAKELYQQGYYILGLRIPGHGTAPSGLVHSSWQDMASAVKLAASHASKQIGLKKPMHIIGYSTGAALAVNYSLAALQDTTMRQAESIVLISPAIGVSSIAALAIWQSRLSIIPGLSKLAWESISSEYDPYKYNSFAVNAGDQIYRLTKEIGNKLSTLNTEGGTNSFPKTLAITSLVDATVSTHAVVTHLFDKLDNAGNELTIFDINRNENFTLFIKNDPIEDYSTLLKRTKLKFDVTFFASDPIDTDTVLEHRWLQKDDSHSIKQTGMKWPNHIYSLSHVALPFSPTDSIYGSEPEDDNTLHIGLLDTKGEKGVLNIAASDMLRLRYNPFYSGMQQQILNFIENPAQQ